MHQEVREAKGFATFNDYIWVLRRYHIPYFDRAYVSTIDQAKLARFDAWRAKELGRTPAQSTLKTHNAALQRVFDEAIDRGWMSRAQVPTLTASTGRPATRRDYLTPDEIAKILKAFPAWIDEGRKAQTRDIRRLLYYYVTIALHTGLRPGTEMDNLRWSDIVEFPNAKLPHVVVTVRKGKTTPHTGPRRVVGPKQLLDIILDMHEWSRDDERLEEIPDSYDPLVFRLPNGEATNELGRNFTALLKQLKLDEGPDGKRTLYSLRHTYITLRLAQGVSPGKLAKTCGTSPAMIQQYYDHMKAPMFVEEILGDDTAELNMLMDMYNDAGI